MTTNAVPTFNYIKIFIISSSFCFIALFLAYTIQGKFEVKIDVEFATYTDCSFEGQGGQHDLTIKKNANVKIVKNNTTSTFTKV